MNNVLDLDEFEIIHESVDHENKTRLFEVNVKDEPYLCTKCGSTYNLDGTFDGKKFKKHDTRKRTVRDSEIRGYKVIIEINQRRYVCLECGEKFRDCLVSKNVQYLISVKAGFIDLGTARVIAQLSVKEIVDTASKFDQDEKVNNDIIDRMNELLIRVLKKSLKLEINSN